MIYKITKTGKIRWVKAILAHLVRCISGHRGTDSDDEDEDEGVLNQDSDSHSSAKHWAKTRTLSISSPDHEARNISTDLHIAAVPKELTLDYTKSSVDQMHLLALADTLASCSATHLVTSTIAIGASKNLSKSGIYCITRHNV